MKRGERPAGGGGTVRRGTKGSTAEKRTRVPATRKKSEVASAALIRDLRMRNTELARALAKLTESRDACTEPYDSAPVGCFTLGRDGTILQANPMGAALLGHDRASVAGRGFRTFVAEEDRRALEEATRRCWAAETPGPCEVRLLRKDGRGIWVHIAVGPGPSEGRGARRCLIVCTDITERKRAEEELRRSKREFELAQQIALVGYWEWDIVGEKLSWSDELCRIWGVQRDFALTFGSIESLIHPDDRALNSAKVRDMLDSADDADYEFRIVRPDGAVRYLHQRTEVIRDESGRALSAFGIMQDITDRRHAMEKLSLQAMLMDQLRDTITATDMEGRVTYANRASYDMLGLENGSLVGKTVHAYGEDARQGATQDEIITATRSAGQWRGLVVNRAIDGRETIQDLRTYVIRDERGNPTGMYGIGTDVTERKRVEEAYRSLVDNSLQGLAILLDGRIAFCNQALCRLSGYSRDEACAMSAEQTMATVHPDDRARVMQGMAELLAGRDVPSRQEMRLVTKDGRLRWVEVLSVRTSYGGRPALQVSYLDVTERREAEAALRLSESRYRGLFAGMGAAVAVYEALEEGQDFAFREFNPGAEKIDGLRAEDVIGRRATEVFPGLVDLGLLDVFRRVWRTGVPEYQEARLYSDPTRRGWRESYVYRLPAGEVVAVYEDVTDRKRVEEELRRGSDQLARANTMLRALGRVAALLQSSAGPADIVLTLGAELRDLGLTCIVALLEADQKSLEVAHTSIAPEALSAIQKLGARALQGYRFGLGRFPAVAAAIEGRHGVFVQNPWPAVRRIATALPGSVREHALRLGGLTHDAPAAVLPLAAGDQIIGVLVAWGPDLVEADIAVLTVFAEQVAVTFHNARMFEEAQTARDRLRDLARHLQSARENERSAIAREIHDELGQIVTALKIDLRWVLKRLDPSRPELLAKTAGMVELADGMIEATHRLASELRPRMLDDLGLVAAIEWLAWDQGRRAGIVCEADVRVTESRIGPAGTTAVFRIVQEALTNVARHARASRAVVRLRDTGAALEVLVQDDGVGIAAGMGEDPHSFGLMGIRERAEALGGRLSIHSEPGKGTSVLVSVPLPAGGVSP